MELLEGDDGALEGDLLLILAKGRMFVVKVKEEVVTGQDSGFSAGRMESEANELDTFKLLNCFLFTFKLF